MRKCRNHTRCGGYMTKEQPAYQSLCWTCFHEKKNGFVGVTENASNKVIYLMEYYDVLTGKSLLRGQYKIGYTSKDVALREAEIGNTMGLVRTRALKIWETDHAEDKEKQIHRLLDEYNTIGEWFKISKAKAIKSINTIIQPYETL